MFDYTSLLLNNWLRFCFKNAKFIYFFISLEVLTIWIECFNSISRILNYYNYIPIDSDNFGLSKLNSANPLYYVKKLTASSLISTSDCSVVNCTFPYYTLVIISAAVTIVLLLQHTMSYLEHKYFLLTDDTHFYDNTIKIGKLVSLTNTALMIIIDTIFRIFSIFLFYLFFNKIIVGLFLNIEIIMVIYSIIFLLLFTFLYIYQINYVNLKVRLNLLDRLHYDIFSQIYDYHLLIIKICIAFNNSLIIVNEKNKYLYHIAFFNLVIIILLFHFSLKSLFNIFISRNLILVTNLKFNLLRLFLILFVCVYILLFIIYNFISVYNIILTNLTSVLFAFTLISIINRRLHILIYEDEKVLYQLIYLLDLYLASESDNPIFENEIIKIKIFHDLQCQRNSKSENCNVCSLEEIKISHLTNDIEKLKLLSAMFSFIENRILKNLTPQELELYNFINLIFNYSLTTLDETIPYYKTVYKTKDLLNKSRRKNNCFYFNLQLYFAKINKHSVYNLKKFKILKKIDSSINSLNQSINIIMEVILTINSKIKKDLYPLTNELNIHKLIILKNLTEINFQKNVYIDNFTFLICKFIFEKLFNLDLNSTVKSLIDSDDFESRLDIIDDRFRNDNIILIKYSVKRNLLIITRASKQFTVFQNRPLEDIFLSDVKEDGKLKFIGMIHTNNDAFHFEFITENENGYIKNLNLDCKIYRSFDLQELFILSTFEITKDDLIVFETSTYYDSSSSKLKLFDLSNNALIAFSEPLEKILYLTPNCLNFIRNSKLLKKNISFDDLFEKSNSLQGGFKTSAPMILNPYNYDFVINYTNYFNNVYRNVEQSNQMIENDEVLQKINDIKYLVKAKIVLSVKVNLKYTIKRYENVDFCVYTLKVTYRRKNSVINSDDIGFFSNRRESLGKEINLDAYLHPDTQIQHTGTTGNNSSASQFLKGNNLLVPYFINTKKINLSSESNMNRFTIVTLLINIFLVIYCVVFFILGFMSNTTLHELNALKVNFNLFEKMFYQTSLSLFYNVGIYNEENNENYNAYWSAINNRVNIPINMGDYGNSELSVKLDLLKLKLNNLQNFIYTSSFTIELNSMFNFVTTTNVFTLTSNGISLNTITTSFFDSVIIYMNNGKSSVFIDTVTMVNIFNYDLNTQLNNFSSITIKELSSVQKTVYEVTMNFPIYLNNFNRIWKDIEALYDLKINNLFNTNNYLSLFLIGLHIFLLFISASILNFLKRTISDSNYILSKLTTGDWTKYLYRKMETLKEIIQFYKIDPIKSFNKLKNEIKENKLRIIKESAIKKKQNSYQNAEEEEEDEEELQSFISHGSEINFKNLISPLIKILAYLFSLYLIYAFSFIILFNISYTDVIVTANYVSANFKVDKSIINTLLLLQIIIISNQTDLSLGKFLQTNSNFQYDISNNLGYIEELVEETKLLQIYSSLLEQNNNKFSNVKTDKNLFSDCDYLYKNINDEVYNVTKKLYNGTSLIDSLTKLCKIYSVMDNRSFDNIIEFIDYTTMKLTRIYNYTYGDYAGGMNLINNDQFFDDFTIILLIFRPIEAQISSNIINTIISDTENNYLVTIILYLIGNIIVEILIFIFINRKLIKRVLVINEEIKCLARCITN